MMKLQNKVGWISWWNEVHFFKFSSCKELCSLIYNQAAVFTWCIPARRSRSVYFFNHGTKLVKVSGFKFILKSRERRGDTWRAGPCLTLCSSRNVNTSITVMQSKGCRGSTTRGSAVGASLFRKSRLRDQNDDPLRSKKSKMFKQAWCGETFEGGYTSWDYRYVLN